MSEHEVAELVRAARRPGKVAHLAEALPARQPEPSESFADLVARCEAEARVTWERGGWAVERQRVATRALLAEGADAAAVDAVARRREAATLVNAAMISRLDECSNAPLTGEGLDVLAAGVPVVVALVHAVPTAATWYGVMRSAGRPSFWPSDRVSTVAEAPALAAMQVRAAEHGGRMVVRRGRYAVYRQLLLEGEICALNLNAPGSAEVAMFGRTRWLTSSIARLASDTGAAVVVAASFLDGARFEVRVSAPVAAASPEEMQQRIVRTAEELLEGDPARLMAPLPSVPPEELEALRASLPALQRQRDEALARWREAQLRQVSGGIA